MRNDINSDRVVPLPGVEYFASEMLCKACDVSWGRTHSQKMTLAARAMADRKNLGI